MPIDRAHFFQEDYISSLLGILGSVEKTHYWGKELAKIHQHLTHEYGGISQKKIVYYFCLRLRLYFEFFCCLESAIYSDTFDESILEKLKEIHRSMLQHIASTPQLMKILKIIFSSCSDYFKNHSIEKLLAEKSLNTIGFCNEKDDAIELFCVAEGIVKLYAIGVCRSECQTSSFRMKPTQDLRGRLPFARKIICHDENHFIVTENEVCNIYREGFLDEPIVHIDFTKYEEGALWFSLPDFFAKTTEKKLALFSKLYPERKVAEILLQRPLKNISQSPYFENDRGMTYHFAITGIDDAVLIYRCNSVLKMDQSSNQSMQFEFDTAPLLLYISDLFQNCFASPKTVEEICWINFNEFQAVGCLSASENRGYLLPSHCKVNTVKREFSCLSVRKIPRLTKYLLLPSPKKSKSIVCFSQNGATYIYSSLKLGVNDQIASFAGEFSEVALSPSENYLAVKRHDNILLFDLRLPFSISDKKIFNVTE